MAAMGAAPSADEAALDTGRRLYREGRDAAGEPLRAVVQGDIAVSGAQLACSGCHRRSGLGSSEGDNLAPPVTGPLLYRAREMQRRELAVSRSNDAVTRPAYTDATLRRALREGIDAGGRPLDPLMPRYRLDEAQIEALIAYLKTLGAQPAPGVDATVLHLATIVTPGVAPASRDAMLQVLREFFDDRNAHTRNEPQRAARGPWYLEWKLATYRDIRLHVWELSGPPDGWETQLERYSAAQPAFAVVSGIGAGDWRPIHAFCEAHALPCLFPNTPLPEIRPGDFYSVYLSEGMALEGRVAARFLAERGLDHGPVLQLVEESPAPLAAAAALRAALPVPPHEVRLTSAQQPIDPARVRASLAGHAARALVIWSTAETGAGLLAEIAARGEDTPLVLVSGTLMPPARSVPAPRADVYIIHPGALPHTPARGEGRIRAWLRSRGIQTTDIATAMNTYSAATIVTGAIKMLAGNYSREYLIERIEHSTENALSSGIYPRLSLGPGQRFASKGAYVLPLSEYRPDATQGQWIIP